MSRFGLLDHLAIRFLSAAALLFAPTLPSLLLRLQSLGFPSLALHPTALHFLKGALPRLHLLARNTVRTGNAIAPLAPARLAIRNLAGALRALAGLASR